MDVAALDFDPGRIVAMAPLPGSALDGVVSLVWAIGRRCNFSCSYCDKEYHDRVSPHRSFDELRAVWINIKRAIEARGEPVAIEFTGGEPTLNPDFLQFVNYLNLTQRKWIRMMGVTTNGSESLAYYEALTTHVDWVCFSTHFEWWDERHFMTMLLDLKRSIARREHRAAINVNVMYESWSVAQVEKAKDILRAEEIQTLPFYVNNMYRSKGIANKASQPFDYAAYLRERDAGATARAPAAAPDEAGISPVIALLAHSKIVDNHDAQITLDDGSTLPVHSQVLANLALNHFPNWRCKAGSERLFINVDGTVYGGMCRIVELGNMFSEFKLLNDSVVCDGRRCWCMSDVRVPKFKDQGPRASQKR